MKLAHDMSGHFDIGVTRSFTNNCHFTRANLSCDVESYVKSCPKCQLYNKLALLKTPLCLP